MGHSLVSGSLEKMTLKKKEEKKKKETKERKNNKKRERGEMNEEKEENKEEEQRRTEQKNISFSSHLNVASASLVPNSIPARTTVVVPSVDSSPVAGSLLSMIGAAYLVTTTDAWLTCPLTVTIHLCGPAIPAFVLHKIEKDGS